MQIKSCIKVQVLPIFSTVMIRILLPLLLLIEVRCANFHEPACSQLSDNRLIANPFNCQTYWYCWHGQAHTADCGTYYRFNQSTGICVRNREQTPCTQNIRIPMCPPISDPIHIITHPHPQSCDK